MRLFYILASIAVGIVVIILIQPNSNKTSSKLPKPIPSIQAAVHYHAGFLVYIDGQLQDFSLDQYMDKSNTVCKLPEKNPTPEENQQEKAHLHN